MSEDADGQIAENDKRIDTLARKARLIHGAGSTVGTTILVTGLYEYLFKEKMDTNMAVAIASMLSSVGTLVVVCFKDLRAVSFNYLMRKRIVRNRRKR